MTKHSMWPTMLLGAVLVFLVDFAFRSLDSNMRQQYRQQYAQQRQQQQTQPKKPHAKKPHGCEGVSSTSTVTLYKCKDGLGGFVVLAVSHTHFNPVSVTR
jgi:hypothetical protein